MKKTLCALAAFLLASQVLLAQEEETEKKGFRKENLFTGGSVSTTFSNNVFGLGVNPVFGYSLTRWADAGLVVNYTYTSFRDYFTLDDRLRQSVYGGGVFARLFPVRFLFAQAQAEHNWIQLKYIPAPNSGNVNQSSRVSANSVLVGAGYTTGRDPDNKNFYGYFAILFDVVKDVNSPYRDNLNRALPILRAGIHVPLFRGNGNNN